MIKGKKIKRLNQSVRRQKRKIVNMKQIISTLTKNNLLQQDEGNVLFDSFGKNKDLIQNLHKKNNNIKKTRKYSSDLRRFSISLHIFPSCILIRKRTIQLSFTPSTNTF